MIMRIRWVRIAYQGFVGHDIRKEELQKLISSRSSAKVALVDVREPAEVSQGRYI